MCSAFCVMAFMLTSEKTVYDFVPEHAAVAVRGPQIGKQASGGGCDGTMANGGVLREWRFNKN